jgi:hypothetical protein
MVQGIDWPWISFQHAGGSAVGIITLYCGATVDFIFILHFVLRVFVIRAVRMIYCSPYG